MLQHSVNSVEGRCKVLFGLLALGGFCGGEFRCFTFILGSLSFCSRRADGLPEADGGAEDEADGEEGGGGEGGFVLAGEFAESIGGRGRAGLDEVAGEVALEVGGEGGGGFVAAGAVFFEGAGGDPVKLAEMMNFE